MVLSSVQLMLTAEAIPFKPYRHKELWDEIQLPLYFTDGGLDVKNTLAAGNEPMLPSAKRIISDPIVRERSVHEIWKVSSCLLLVPAFTHKTVA